MSNQNWLETNSIRYEGLEAPKVQEIKNKMPRFVVQMAQASLEPLDKTQIRGKLFAFVRQLGKDAGLQVGQANSLARTLTAEYFKLVESDNEQKNYEEPSPQNSSSEKPEIRIVATEKQEQFVELPKQEAKLAKVFITNNAELISSADVKVSETEYAELVEKFNQNKPQVASSIISLAYKVEGNAIPGKGLDKVLSGILKNEGVRDYLYKFLSKSERTTDATMFFMSENGRNLLQAFISKYPNPTPEVLSIFLKPLAEKEEQIADKEADNTVKSGKGILSMEKAVIKSQKKVVEELFKVLWGKKEEYRLSAQSLIKRLSQEG